MFLPWGNLQKLLLYLWAYLDIKAMNFLVLILWGWRNLGGLHFRVLRVTLFNASCANWRAPAAFVSLLPLNFLSGLKIRGRNCGPGSLSRNAFQRLNLRLIWAWALFLGL